VNKIDYEIPEDKVVKLTYKNETATFRLIKKRAFVVLIEMVKRYPRLMNIHELDSFYNDPNRALSDLRNEDGFGPFINIKYGKKGVMHTALDVEKLFKSINKKTKIIELAPAYRRANISEAEKKKIFKLFGGTCNITGVKLHYKDDFKYRDVFMKKLQIAAFDHRKPIVKSGNNDEHNWQLVSSHVNQEKNKICNACINSKCDTCALAYPEKVSVIYPTGQDISALCRDGNGK